MSEPEQRRILRLVVAYEERYHRPYWGGRDGVTDTELSALADLGLLARERGEHGLRWWYATTRAGRAMAA